MVLRYKALQYPKVVLPASRNCCNYSINEQSEVLHTPVVASVA